MSAERFKLALFSADDSAQLLSTVESKSEGSYLSYNEHDPYRAFMVYSGEEDRKLQTSSAAWGTLAKNNGKLFHGKNVFLFPGNGIHQKQMLTILSGVSEFLASELKKLEKAAEEFYPVRLLDEQTEDAVIDQLRVFASEVVLADLWIKSGCVPDYLIGYSMGEYAAAVCSGLMSASDAMYLLVQRAGIMHEDEPHWIAAVETDADTIIGIAEKNGLEIEISGYNAEDLVTVCGISKDISALNEICKSMRIRLSIINQTHGGHYSGLKDCAERFTDIAKKVTFRTPHRKMLSTVSSGDLTPEQPAYWGAHIVRPVLFRQAVGALPRDEISRVIDIGVSPVLISMAMKNLGNIGAAWIPTIRSGRNYRKQILTAAGNAFLSGVNIKTDFLI